MPEVKDWSDAKRGLFYRPVKQQLTLRIDSDLVAWFKSRTPQGEGYQTNMNRALREELASAGGDKVAGWVSGRVIVV